MSARDDLRRGRRGKVQTFICRERYNKRMKHNLFMFNMDKEGNILRALKLSEQIEDDLALAGKKNASEEYIEYCAINRAVNELDIPREYFEKCMAEYGISFNPRTRKAEVNKEINEAYKKHENDINKFVGIFFLLSIAIVIFLLVVMR